MDSGHRQRQRAGAAGAPHGHGHQRHPEPQTALGTGAAGRLAGHRRRAARHPLAHLRRRALICPSAPRCPSLWGVWCAGLSIRPRSAAARGSDADSEISPGSLFASGLIAAGGIVGLIGVALKAYRSHRTTRATSSTSPTPSSITLRLGGRLRSCWRIRCITLRGSR